MHTHTSSSVRGFNLAELAMVLGIMGIVLGGVFYSASFVRSASLTRQASDDTRVILENIRTLLSGASTYFPGGGAGADITAAMTTAGVFPNSMRIKNNNGTYGSAINPWNDPYVVTLGPLLNGSSRTFRLTSYVATEGACKSLVASMAAANGLELVLSSPNTWAAPTVPFNVTNFRCRSNGGRFQVGFEFSFWAKSDS